MTRRSLLLTFSLLALGPHAIAAIPVDEPVIGPLAHQDLARIAHGRDGYLAVWRDYRANGDMYATRISNSGVVLDPLGIRVAPGQLSGAIAAVPDGYLIVTGGGCGSIDGYFVGNDGSVAPPMHIADRGGSCFSDVDVATNGETVLAEWDGKGALLDTRGRVIRGSLDFGGSYRSAVASNGSDYLVANLSGSNIATVRVSRRGDVAAAQVIHVFGGNDIAIASDGTDYLAAVTGWGLALQRVKADGSSGGATQFIDLGGSHTISPRVAWNGSEFAVVWTRDYITGTPRGQLVRLQREGTPILPVLPGPFVAQPQFWPSDIAASADGFLLLSDDDQSVLRETIVRNADFTAGVLPSMSPVAFGAQTQTLARLGVVAGRLVVMWNEWAGNGPATLRAREFTSAGVPLTPTVDVGAAMLGVDSSYAIAFDGTYIVIGWANAAPQIRRFTLDLVPVDPQPIILASGGYLRGMSLAASSGTTLAAWQSNSAVAAALIHTADTTPAIQRLVLPKPRFYDRYPAATGNGAGFALIWPTSTGPPPLQGLYLDPPDDLVGLRISSTGSLIDTTPILIEHIGASAWVLATANETTGYLAWEPNPSSDKTTPGVYGVPIDDSLIPTRAPELLWGPAGMIAVAPHGPGFVVAWRTFEDPYNGSVKLRVVDESGSPVGFAQLPTQEYYALVIGVQSIDGNVVVAADSIAYGEPYGGVSRVFLQPVQIQPERRRAVRR